MRYRNKMRDVNKRCKFEVYLFKGFFVTFTLRKISAHVIISREIPLLI